MERVDVIKDICQQLNLTQIDNSWIKTLGQHLGVDQLPGLDNYEQRVFIEAISNSEVVIPLPNFGQFAISDQDGFYNYYPTLQTAIDDATSGQVVEVFANYVEINPVTVTLKDGVIINGNGHSYTTMDGTVDAFVGSGITTSILNYNFKFLDLREYYDLLKTGIRLINSDVDFKGSTIYSEPLAGQVETNPIYVTGGNVRNLYIKSTGTNVYGLQAFNSANINRVDGVSTGVGIDGAGIIKNCNFTSNGNAIFGDGVYHSIGESVNGNGIYGLIVVNSYGKSNNNPGIDGVSIYNSVSNSGGTITVF